MRKIVGLFTLLLAVYMIGQEFGLEQKILSSRNIQRHETPDTAGFSYHREEDKVEPAEDYIDLNKTDAVAVYERILPVQKKNLSYSVIQYCKLKYHAESCLHYVLACGKPCLKSLTMEERQRIQKFYRQEVAKVEK